MNGLESDATPAPVDHFEFAVTDLSTGDVLSGLTGCAAMSIAHAAAIVNGQRRQLLNIQCPTAPSSTLAVQ